MACGILAEMLSMDSQTSNFVLQKFTGSGSAAVLSNLTNLVDINQSICKTDMYIVQGTNFGCPYTGYFDQPFNLVQKLQRKLIYDARSANASANK